MLDARVMVEEILRVNPEMSAGMAEALAGRAMARRPEEAAALAESLRQVGLR